MVLFDKLYGKYVKGRKLNLGCAFNHMPGWTNLDMDTRVGADVVWNMECTPLPFPDGSFDTILASHVFEHVRELVPLIYDLGRILTKGGNLIAVTPHGASDDAWDCPHHVRGFTENTWAYFSKRLYDDEVQRARTGYGAYQGDNYHEWNAKETWLVPYPEFQDDPDIEFKARHWRNVIREVHVVMEKM